MRLALSSSIKNEDDAVEAADREAARRDKEAKKAEEVAKKAAAEAKKKAESAMPYSEPIDEIEDNCIYDSPQVMASFPGGENAAYAWLGKNMIYPTRCKEQVVQGRVMVKLVVEKDGSIGTVQVIRSPHDDLSTEAVRLTKAMPRWNPARQGGKPVRAYFTLPVMFRIQ